MKKNVLKAAAVMTLLLCGCSEPAPDMSTVRTNLVLDILDLTRSNRHDEAAVKIQKLRQLDPTNIYLPELESVERSNGDLQKVNALLHKDDRDGATKLLRKMVRQHTHSRTAFRTAEQLKDVIRMERLTESIIHPRSVTSENTGCIPASRVLSQSVEEFLLLAQKWNAPTSLRNKVIRNLSRVKDLQEEESFRASLSMELFSPDLPESPSQTILAVKKIYDGTKQK